LKVTIITVVYNGVETIADCMNSVLCQTYPHIEYIIIDGNSTDGTQQAILDIKQQYSQHNVQLVSESDKGIYDAMNKGIGLATGDVVGILNADDLYTTEKVIENIVNLFETARTDAVYGDLIYTRKEDISTITRYWRAGVYKTSSFLWGWMPPHPTFFVKRWAYQAYGVFNLNLKSAADYELMLRFIYKHKITLAYLPKTITIMREGGMSNVSFNNRIKANMEDRKAWKINGLTPNIFTLWLKFLRKIPQFYQKPVTIYSK
jgi:glycosyltransferase involved in cell wall biosynthesis